VDWAEHPQVGAAKTDDCFESNSAGVSTARGAGQARQEVMFIPVNDYRAAQYQILVFNSYSCIAIWINYLLPEV